MSVRCIQNSGEYRVSGAVDRVPSSERHDTVSSLRRITRIAPFSTLSKPDRGLIVSLAKPPIGASLSSQRCGRKALPITLWRLLSFLIGSLTRYRGEATLPAGL